MLWAMVLCGVVVDLNLWTREPNTGSLTRAGELQKLDHTGKLDWSLQLQEPFKTREGDLVEIRAIGRRIGNAAVSASVHRADGTAIEWTAGRTNLPKGSQPSMVVARFIAPKGAANYRPRIVGDGPGTVWVGKLEHRIVENLADRRKALPQKTVLRKPPLEITVGADGSLDVLDLRNKRVWKTHRTNPGLVPISISKTSTAITIKGLDAGTAQDHSAVLILRGDEVHISVDGSGPLGETIYPEGFRTPAGSTLVLPMNEGIGYPVEDPAVPEWYLVAYGGHGICMPWWGVADRGAAAMTILETADDAGVRLTRFEGLAVARPAWEGQKGKFGYERRLRLKFIAKGDHVEMAKAYRAYVKSQGRLVTLAEKRKRVPAVDKLVGALNLWTWDSRKVELAKALKQAGMDRVLWSGAGDPQQLKAIRELGYLVGRYDIVQDAMDPAQFPNLPWIHPDWTSDAWPKDLMRDAELDWVRGWEVEDKSGKRVPCGTLCDRQAIPYADKRIGEELKTHPYEARFMDTTTASPWRECYDPAHPMTRTDSRIWKMKLLELMSKKYKLVSGSETGHDAAVPYVDYFEGMLSLGPYRTEDSGRQMSKEWSEVPEALSKFQVGWKYRLPLWELVYHDCVVAHWYWGDHNHKLPALWDLRDRFNALYGTVPLFWLDIDRFKKEPARFLQSYRDTVPIARATGYAEMVGHRYLSADKSVQETTFSNGARVVVNFGSRPAKVGAKALAPMGLDWKAR